MLRFTCFFSLVRSECVLFQFISLIYYNWAIGPIGLIYFLYFFDLVLVTVAGILLRWLALTPCPMPLARLFQHHAGSEEGFVEPTEPADPAEAVFRKRQRQTQKARVAAIKSFALKRFRKQQQLLGLRNAEHVSRDLQVAEELQKTFFTKRLHHEHSKRVTTLDSDKGKSMRRNQGRCVWSLLCAVVNALEKVFSVAQPHFVINTVVPDDTNTRLKGPATNDRTMVYTVMNQVSSCIVHYIDECPEVGSKWQCLAIPSPVIVLNTPNTAHLHSAYTSFLLSAARGIGVFWERLGLSPVVSEGVKNARWAVQIMTGDALEANSSMFNLERLHLAQFRAQERSCNKLAIRFKCGNHQLNLVRKPCVLSIERYWSTLVRLAHLFECTSFRRRFIAGILGMLQNPGTVQRPLAV